MMRYVYAALAALALAAATALLQARPAAAHEYRAGAIHIDHPVVTPTPGGRNVTAGYFTLHNSADTPDQLVGASSPLAGRVEIHRTSRSEAGVMRMELLPEGVALPAGEAVVFRRGGLHLMLLEVTRPLAEGDEVPLTLVFENAGAVDVVAMVERPSAGPQTAPQGGGHDHHGHGHGGDAP